MAVQLDPSGKDDKNEIKTHFVTREGVYRILNLSAEEFVRPRPGVGYNQSNQSQVPLVRVSFVSLPTASLDSASAAPTGTFSGSQDCPSTSSSSNLGGQDRICYNVGKDLFIYSFKGIRKLADLNKPDKKTYKGTSPCCHDFNATTATSDGVSLVVGFTTGQIQLIHPGRRDTGKLFNEDRLIDKTKVTCIKWIPSSPNLFIAAHASGSMYLYNEELSSQPTVAPSYQPFKCGDGYAVLLCKSKTARNPLYKWTFGSENFSINEVCFSPCGTNLAVVSQDGFLRVFQYNTMELVGMARSYFGGFLCVCWSPDGKYIVVGGEDDLVTIYSFHEKRVVARGQGHRSWVSVVAFDPFITNYSNWDGLDFSDDENPINESYHRYVHHHENHTENRAKKTSSVSARDSMAPDKLTNGYRLGSVGQDTQLCFWDITEDVLRQIGHRPRLSSNEGLTNGDDVPIIKPVATTTSSVIAKNQVDTCVKGTGKLLNCTNVEISDSKELISSDSSSKFINSTSSKTNSLASNCIGNSVSASKDSLNDKSASSTLSSRHSASGIGADSTTTLIVGNSSSNHNSNHSSSAFNTLTQKLSNFSFGSDKNNVAGKVHKKRNFTLSKSNEKQLLNHVNGSSSSNTQDAANLPGTSTNSLTKSSKSLSSSTTSGAMSSSTTVDPMKIIGSSACPRFEDTPVLEPLICKKIAHERLTALIFREDCFIAACQDGLIYTWARPGYGYQQSVQHNLPTSPTTIPGGTVV